MSILVTIVLIGIGIWLFIKVLPILGIILLFYVITRIVRTVRNNNSDSDYSDSSSASSYILNKKTGVIHNRWDSSVDTISSRHQIPISSSEAWDLVNRGTRYRFKQDP
jgi:hypothetical protein